MAYQAKSQSRNSLVGGVQATLHHKLVAVFHVEFVVHCRQRPGEFYALPQSPQIFKVSLLQTPFTRILDLYPAVEWQLSCRLFNDPPPPPPPGDKDEKAWKQHPVLELLGVDSMAENIADAAIAYDCWRGPLLSNSKVSHSHTRFMRITFLHPVSSR